MSDWLQRIWGRDHSVGSSKLEPGERMCPGTGEVTTCMADCHPLGENCNGQASREERAVLELSPALQNMETPTLMNEEVREAVQRLYEKGVSIREMVETLREEGYTADFLLTGRPAEQIIEGEVAEDVDLGDLLEVDSSGRFRRADHGRIVGVALGDGRVRLTAGGFRGMEMSWAERRPVGSIAYYGSMAYQASIIGGPGRHGFPRAGGPARFQFNERFPKEVVDKAMKLLEKFMSPDQYEAFLRGDRIELENKAGNHRIMISRTGDFTILRGPRGAGIVMTSGRCRSYKYPLGDEIAAFLDWFNHRTEELIDRWKCGTFGIIEEGKGR